MRPPEQLVATDVGGADIDNALSAVAKMMKLAPDSIPMAQVLPVVLAALPLRVDQDEALNVYGSITGLMLAGNAVVLGMLPQVLTAMCGPLSGTFKTDDGVKVVIITGLKQFARDARFNAVFAAAVSQISDVAIRGILEAALSS